MSKHTVEVLNKTMIN